MFGFIHAFLTAGLFIGESIKDTKFNNSSREASYSSGSIIWTDSNGVERRVFNDNPVIHTYVGDDYCCVDKKTNEIVINYTEKERRRVSAADREREIKNYNLWRERLDKAKKFAVNGLYCLGEVSYGKTVYRVEDDWMYVAENNIFTEYNITKILLKSNNHLYPNDKFEFVIREIPSIRLLYKAPINKDYFEQKWKKCYRLYKKDIENNNKNFNKLLNNNKELAMKLKKLIPLNTLSYDDYVNRISNTATEKHDPKYLYEDVFAAYRKAKEEGLL